MKSIHAALVSGSNTRPLPKRWIRLSRHLLLRTLARLGQGRLIIKEGRKVHHFGSRSKTFPVRAAITVHDPRFYPSSLWGGSIGAGEAYMAGHWSADDLGAVMRILARNLSLLQQMDGGVTALFTAAHRLFHWRRRNTRQGSRGNIGAHYDLGNDFYALFLDQTMTYSCALFEPDVPEDLRAAQIAKYERICRKLRLTSSDHVLEIGTGWGGFAIHAAGRYGCQVTTTTLSQAQRKLATERIVQAGLADRIKVRQQDYRDLNGRYDKLVSIEMIEAVGHHFFETFFGACSRLLKPEGIMLLQAITIADQAFEQHKRTVDFIKRYIFPGSCLPSVTAMMRATTRATDLRLVHLEDLTPHYAQTLHLWRQRFLAKREQVRALGFSDNFIRMWEFYLAYCEGGFIERYLGDLQLLLAKPLCRQEPILAPLSV